MKKQWKTDQWNEAARLARLGKSCEEIVDALDDGFTDLQVRNRFLNCRYSGDYDGPLPPLRRGEPVPQLRPREGDDALSDDIIPAQERQVTSFAKVPRDLLDDRDRRATLRLEQSLTASFFGDPPPGYSALDRRGR